MHQDHIHHAHHAFTDEAYRRALFGCLMLSISACPVGVFLMLRRMSLAGDSLSHAILPGAAAAFLMFGLQVIPMTIGGMIAGLVVALAAGAISRLTVLREDTALAVFYAISLATGALILGGDDHAEELVHFLFGDVAALTDGALRLIAFVMALTLASLALFWRAIVADSFDPLFLRSVSRLGAPAHFVFLALLVLNLIASLQALGALLAVGLMALPAAAARFWTARVGVMAVVASAIGMASSALGLTVARFWELTPGPSIIMAAGFFFALSVLFSPRGLVGRRQRRRHRHS